MLFEAKIYDVNTQDVVLDAEQLETLVPFKDFNETIVGVQFLPYKMDLEHNETQYELDCQTIINSTSLLTYNYDSKGFDFKETVGGDNAI